MRLLAVLTIAFAASLAPATAAEPCGSAVVGRNDPAFGAPPAPCPKPVPEKATRPAGTYVFGDTTVKVSGSIQVDGAVASKSTHR
ncbi:MAG: hypothetical protein ABTQ29_06015 [Siculibacillus sp.]